MSIIIDTQYAAKSKNIPKKGKIGKWANACLSGITEHAELTIRIVDEEEGTKLNMDWCNGKSPTNVLSFPSDDNPLAPYFLGDVVICAPVVIREATEQGKLGDAHWAHMIIHGILHLVGYDHINDKDAIEMESLEIKKLESIGFPNPYI